MGKQISYSKRDFNGLREELVNFTKQYYPDLISNFNDASIYSVLLDMNAAIADNLHFHIDRVWQETILDFAQQKQSLFHIAKTYGVKIPGNRSSVALCDFSINVPPRGDKDDERYEGVLRAGAQLNGGGQIFETIDDIDFSNPFNSKGEPNRLKVPNFDGNNRLISYTITKREAVINGVSKIYRKVINESDQKPFFKLFLPEKNVLGVLSVIHKDGDNIGTNPTTDEFMSLKNKWYEVDSLIEDKIFVENKTQVSDNKNHIPGDYVKVINKFCTEYTPEGYFSLTFGSGNVDPMENLDNYVTNNIKVNLSTFLNNTSLGSIPKLGSTLFVKYRIGGGKDSNIGINVINTINMYEYLSNGPNSSISEQVGKTLNVINVTPAIGGSDIPSIEEIRNMISYNFSAQKRAVTLNDYKSIIENMPSVYGAPAKVNVIEEDNKIKIKLLSYDDNGSLVDIVSNTLKNNITNYISNYRMINDYVEVESGEVIDLGLKIDITIDKNGNQTDIFKSVYNEIVSFFSVDKRKIGDPLFIGDLQRIISNVVGVVNVVNIFVFNMTGGNYSSSEVSQEYVDKTTKEISPVDNMIHMKSNQIFQIRYPSTDIKIRSKTILNATY